MRRTPDFIRGSLREAVDRREQTVSQPQPANGADVRDLGTAPGGAGVETTARPQLVTSTKPRQKEDTGSAPTEDAPPSKREIVTTTDQNALTAEQADTLFPAKNYGAYTAAELHNANIANFKEGERLHGKFTAHLYDCILPGLNESIKRLKNGKEINGFTGERQVGAYLESIGYTAELVRQWNKRYRDRMTDLKKALGLTDGNVDNLTPERRELRDDLMQQGYKSPEATRLARVAEGNTAIDRFNWVMTYRANQISGAITEESNTQPAIKATEPNTGSEPGSVTTVTHRNVVGELDDAAESDEPVTSEPEAEVTGEEETPVVQPTGTTDAEGLKAEFTAEPDRRAVEDEGREAEKRSIVEQERVRQTLENAPQLPTPPAHEDDDDEDDALFTQYDPNKEPPEGRPTYKIMLTVTGSRLEATLKKAQEAFGDKLLNVEKVSRISSRADQMAEAVGLMEDAKSACEDLKEQIESWKDNLPENFQEKSSQLEECMDQLEQVVNSLDEAQSNAESVEFPGMY
jgi:hypothetical protein